MRPPKPHELKKLPITKLDAARRQLETAIPLWFQDADPVSVHTLVMAADGIPRAFNKKRGGQPMLRDPNHPHIRLECEERVADILAGASNARGQKPARDSLIRARVEPIHDLRCMPTVQVANARRKAADEDIYTYIAFHFPELFEQEYLGAVQRSRLSSEAKRFSKREFFAKFLLAFALFTQTSRSVG